MKSPFFWMKSLKQLTNDIFGINSESPSIGYFWDIDRVLWVISSGKMVISGMSSWIHPRYRAKFDSINCETVFPRKTMNQQETKATYGYEATAEELQKVILEWATVIDAFRSRYDKLDYVIRSLQPVIRRQPENKERLWKLIELRNQMSDALMKLLLDMDMSGQRANRSLRPSKPGQLHSHTSLLNDLNRQMDTALISFTTVAQA